MAAYCRKSSPEHLLIFYYLQPLKARARAVARTCYSTSPRANSADDWLISDASGMSHMEESRVNIYLFYLFPSRLDESYNTFERKFCLKEWTHLRHDCACGDKRTT